jgi:hypothetical protein
MVRIVPPRNTTPGASVGVGSALGVVGTVLGVVGSALGVVDSVGAFVVGAQESITALAAMAAATPRNWRRDIRSSKVIHP